MKGTLFLFLVISLAFSEAKINPTPTVLSMNFDTSSYAVESIVSNEQYIFVAVDSQISGTTLYNTTVFLIDNTNPTKLSKLSSVHIGHCDSSLVEIDSNSVLLICNFQSSALGPVEFYYLKVQNSELVISQHTYYPLSENVANAQFGGMNKKKDKALLYGLGNKNSNILYSLDLPSLRFTIIEKNILPDKYLISSGTFVSSGASDIFVGFAFEESSHKTKFLSYDLASKNVTHQNGDACLPYSFLQSYQDADGFAILSSDDELVLQKWDFGNWIPGKKIQLPKTDFFSAGVYVSMTDKTLFVLGYRGDGHSYSTLNQIDIESWTVTDQLGLQTTGVIAADTKNVLTIVGNVLQRYTYV